MHTTSSICASTASRTASFAYFAGTKTTETLAPVASFASCTEPKTGIGFSSKRTDSPPLPGVTPPTMREPDINIRWVCLRPSEPVMPWTMMRDWWSRKIDICCSSGFRRGGRCEFGGLARGVVHGVNHGDQRMGVLGEDVAPDLH